MEITPAFVKSTIHKIHLDYDPISDKHVFRLILEIDDKLRSKSQIDMLRNFCKEIIGEVSNG